MMMRNIKMMCFAASACFFSACDGGNVGEGNYFRTDGGLNVAITSSQGAQILCEDIDQLTPCGGEVGGTWMLAQICDPDGQLDDVLGYYTCSAMTESASYSVWDILEFEATTYLNRKHNQLASTVVFGADCLGETQGCGTLETTDTSCNATVGGCRCISVIEDTGFVRGNYSVDGPMMTLNVAEASDSTAAGLTDSFEYCRSDNLLILFRGRMKSVYVQ